MKRQDLSTEHLTGLTLAVATPPDQMLTDAVEQKLLSDFRATPLPPDDHRRVISGELGWWTPQGAQADAILSAACAGDPQALLLRRRVWRRAAGGQWRLRVSVFEQAAVTMIGSEDADHFVHVPQSPWWVGGALGDEMPYAHDPNDYRKKSVSYADLAAAVDRRVWKIALRPR